MINFHYFEVIYSLLIGNGGHSAATSLLASAYGFGHLTGEYVARSRSPKFRLTAKLHISPKY